MFVCLPDHGLKAFNESNGVGRLWHVAVQSAVNFESWGARRFWRLTIIVACSMIIYIIIWSSQLGPPSTSIVPAYHLGSKKSGFVFPLHRHRSRFPDASDVMEGGMRRGRRAASRRCIGEEAYPLLNAHTKRSKNHLDEYSTRGSSLPFNFLYYTCVFGIGPRVLM